MNYYQIAVIGLLSLNLILIILTGRAIILQIKTESYDLSQFLVNSITEQLPEAIGNAVSEIGQFEQPNPIQQMAVEWMRNMMNSQPLTATVTDLPRAEDGKFKKLEDQS